MNESGSHERRLGFAVKVLGNGGMKTSDARRWQSGPDLGRSIELLLPALDWMASQGIRMYRISSDFVPYATHPDLPQFHRQIEGHASALEALGRRARELDIRLSLHPSQYIVLNSTDDDVVAKSVWDLDAQAELLDALGQGAEAVVVLHVGGVYGDRIASRERFLRHVDRLSDRARRRLVIENDESCYTVVDCLWLHERTGLRVVFDHQHHRLNPGEMDTESAARAALATWPDHVVPKVHFSSPRLDAREVGSGRKRRVQPPLLRQHADYVDPWTFADFVAGLSDLRFDVMLEAKAKDLALLRLRRDLETIGRADVLRQPAPAGAAEPGSGRWD